MTYTTEFIDEVVRNVMRELNGSSSDATPAPLAVATSAVAIPGSVITEEILCEHQAAGGIVQLAAGAVITPSGRDYIRRHGITVTKGGADAPASTTSTSGQVIAVGRAPSLLTAASTAGWNVTPACGNFDAANQVAQSDASIRSVCCSGQPSVIACLLNRNTTRRVAVIDPSICLTELTQEMNPDTVCLSPTGWSFADLLKLLRHLNHHESGAPGNWKELP